MEPVARNPPTALLIGRVMTAIALTGSLGRMRSRRLQKACKGALGVRPRREGAGGTGSIDSLQVAPTHSTADDAHLNLLPIQRSLVKSCCLIAEKEFACPQPRSPLP